MNSYYTREELSVNTFWIQLYSILYPLDRTGVRFFFLIIIDSDEKHAAFVMLQAVKVLLLPNLVQALSVQSFRFSSMTMAGAPRYRGMYTTSANPFPVVISFITV